MRWLEDQSSLVLWRIKIFPHDNAPAHRSKYTFKSLGNIGLNDKRVIIWPLKWDSSLIEKLWAISTAENMATDGSLQI